MSLIRWPYRLLALAALAVALIGFGWVKGAGHVQARWDAAVQQQTLQANAIREHQALATVKVVTEYVDRVRVVREKGDTIIKAVDDKNRRRVFSEPTSRGDEGASFWKRPIPPSGVNSNRHLCVSWILPIPLSIGNIACDRHVVWKKQFKQHFCSIAVIAPVFE